uniref:Uncharacterized protein n=1 Tax=Pseudo-nitzschia australis TaxID=44445 RepID=A0A7S4AQ86_9STRA|mmetsp:Transcript_23729/g.49958  ORF Transcript_23729/g.49958 Transcript_23729/m.49958 type:complete len:102 (+) Transcript_23729:818-1123(+)
MVFLEVIVPSLVSLGRSQQCIYTYSCICISSMLTIDSHTPEHCFDVFANSRCFLCIDHRTNKRRGTSSENGERPTTIARPEETILRTIGGNATQHHRYVLQ